MGKSSSDASTKTTTSYKTTTSTTVGDIGFTGKDAIAFETALLQHNLASQQQVFTALNNLSTRASSFGPSGASNGPTESEPEEKKPQTNYVPLLLAGGAAIAVYFLFLR
jgi:hypothetical protein